MSEGLVVLSIVLAFSIGFPLMWVAIVHLIAWIGGWKRLARDFAAAFPTNGSLFSWRSGAIGFFGQYSHSLEVRISPEGIALRTVLPFRPGHRSLVLPWPAVTGLGSGRRFLQMETRLEVRLHDARTMRLSLYGRDIADALARNAPAHLRNRTP